LARIPVGENDRRAVNDCLDMAEQRWSDDDRRLARLRSLAHRINDAMTESDMRDRDTTVTARRARRRTVIDEDGQYRTVSDAVEEVPYLDDASGGMHPIRFVDDASSEVDVGAWQREMAEAVGLSHETIAAVFGTNYTQGTTHVYRNAFTGDEHRILSVLAPTASDMDRYMHATAGTFLLIAEETR
jgi:hypothetical protein